MRMSFVVVSIALVMGLGCDSGGDGGGIDTVGPGEDTVLPGPDTAGPAEDTTGPGEDTALPPEDTVEPTEDTIEPPEDTINPPEDTVEPPEDTTEPSECGDEACNGDENPCTCPKDCPVGDGYAGAACCDALTDCAQPKCGPCCVVTCDDFVCSAETWLSPCCWNGECEEGEDWETCPEDCPPPPPDCEDFSACLTDQDCVKTAAGCCPCSMGGTSLALNSECVDAYNDLLACPPDLNCIAMYNCDGSTPTCEDGKCTLVGGGPEF